MHFYFRVHCNKGTTKILTMKYNNLKKCTSSVHRAHCFYKVFLYKLSNPHKVLFSVSTLQSPTKYNPTATFYKMYCTHQHSENANALRCRTARSRRTYFTQQASCKTNFSEPQKQTSLSRGEGSLGRGNHRICSAFFFSNQ